jgi:hypothetical protein
MIESSAGGKVGLCPRLAAGIAMDVILPGLVFLTFRVAAVLADV